MQDLLNNMGRLKDRKVADRVLRANQAFLQEVKKLEYCDGIVFLDCVKTIVVAFWSRKKIRIGCDFQIHIFSQELYNDIIHFYSLSGQGVEKLQENHPVVES